MKVALQFIRKEDGVRSPAICVDMETFPRECKERMSDEDLKLSAVLILGEFHLDGDSERFEWSGYPILDALDFVELHTKLSTNVVDQGVEHA